MCEACHAERDDDYDGDSIEAKRTKAIQSIVDRHPELGLSPDSITVRFAPRAEQACIRVNTGSQLPRYEIHVPSYTAQVMASSPALWAIAMAAWIETDRSYEDLCATLEIKADLPYGGFFVSPEPPINPSRAEAEPEVHKYEWGVREELSKDH